MGPNGQVDVTVLTSAHHVADARLHRICGALVRAGCRVEVRAHGRPDAAPAHVRYLPRHPPAGPVRRSFASLVLPARARGDVVVILDPDLIGPASLWRWVRRWRLVVDIHEDYLAVSRDRPWVLGPLGAVVRTGVRLLTLLATRADLTVVADDHLPPREASARRVVRNLPSRGEIPSAWPRDPQPRAVYVGDVRPSRGLWTMLDALELAPGWRLDVIGPLSEVSQPVVAQALRQRGLDDRVHFHGRRSPERTWELVRGAWCGLALLRDTPAYRAAVPTKVYEYMSAGLAVLASPLPRVRTLLEGAGTGLTADSAASAAAILRDWADEPAGLAVLQRHAAHWAEQHLAPVSPFDGLALDVVRLRQERRSTHEHPGHGERRRRRARLAR
jgi:glycosyltransferase involved in cell wall biosynthesis